MLELYKPDMYKHDIYSIDYKKLKSCGIKCILFDLDNTIIPTYLSKPTRKLKDFIEKLKDMKLKVIIISNSGKKRLLPFKDILEVDCAASARKPSKKKYQKILDEYKYDVSEIVVIGDQLVTDIFGGNRMGFYTILVDPISKQEYIWTKFNRIKEKCIMFNLKRKNLFKRGSYYE